MIVSANRFDFNLVGLKKLKPTDKVQVNSGMGGTFTLIVDNVSEVGLSLTGNVNAPSWFKKVEYSWEEALSSLFLLMPSADYGVKDQHIALARKAGYESDSDIVEAVSTSANTYAYLVERLLKG